MPNLNEELYNWYIVMYNVLFFQYYINVVFFEYFVK
jgi:hypothetical protein